MSLSNDNDIKIGGGKWGGSVIILVNNNPVVRKGVKSALDA